MPHQLGRIRRAELRRKLRWAEERKSYWGKSVWNYGLDIVQRRDATKYQYWSDVARMLRRTLREEK